jgi:hypothetical protein
MGTTAKAMIKLLVGTDSKRRCFFVMEGAAGVQIFARFFERDARIDNIYDIDTSE